MSKQARAREFSAKERKKIYQRDDGKCIYCVKQYRMEKATWLGLEIKSVMHYIPRSHNGLGIEQNGAIGCQYHHEMLDNGSGGNREEMLDIFREHLSTRYPEWNEEMLVYSKWDRLESGRNTR